MGFKRMSTDVGIGDRGDVDYWGCASRDMKGNTHQALSVCLHCGGGVDLGNGKKKCLTHLLHKLNLPPVVNTLRQSIWNAWYSPFVLATILSARALKHQNPPFSRLNRDAYT